MSGSKIPVLLVNDHLGWGKQMHGVARLLYLWSKHLDHRKFEPSVCILRKRTPLVEPFKRAGISVTFLGKSKYDASTLMSLVNLIRRENIRLLHLQGYGGSTFGRLAAAITGVPSIVHFHDTNLHYPRIQRTADRVLSGVTSQFVAVSPRTRALWAARCGIDPGKILILANCVETQALSKTHLELIKSVRHSLGASNGTRLVGMITRLFEDKGVDCFIEAARIVRSSHEGSKFVVVGDGPLKGVLMEKAHELDLDDDLVFIGSTNRVAEYLGAFDIFASASYSGEGFPLSVLEAMAMGKPIVATSTVETIVNGESGLVVPPRDAASLAGSIVDLLEHPETAAKLGEAAKATSKSFDVANVIPELQRVYEAVLSDA